MSRACPSAVLKLLLWVALSTLVLGVSAVRPAVWAFVPEYALCAGVVAGRNSRCITGRSAVAPAAAQRRAGLADRLQHRPSGM